MSGNQNPSFNSNIQIPFTIMDKIPDKFGSKDDKKSDSSEPEAKMSKMEKDCRDHAISWLTKYPTSGGYLDVSQKYPDHLPLYAKILTSLYEKMETKDDDKDGVFCDADLLQKVTEDVLAKYDFHQTLAEGQRKSATKAQKEKLSLVKDALVGQLLLHLAGGLDVTNCKDDENVSGIFQKLIMLEDDLFKLTTSGKQNLINVLANFDENSKFKYQLKSFHEQSSGKKDPTNLYQFGIEVQFREPSDNQPASEKRLLKCKKVSKDDLQRQIIAICQAKGWNYLAVNIEREAAYNNLSEILSF